ncbi:hypothetical protein RJ639_035160 [Escallonia herrerae]|uniref:Protein kinase domain-containing protein n=1 Tax=Escallonia herrerae TaxID=1293975 RepID=A0AA89BI68_9ASTE|nr:hypothetical protein RJ639_035160 [Escallonia herrerae]
MQRENVKNKESGETSEGVKGRMYQTPPQTLTWPEIYAIGKSLYNSTLAWLQAQLHGQVVAVKKLSSPSKQKLQEFNTEVLILSSYKHENLVRLFGGYSGKDLHLLICEYMEHKSLAEALFGNFFIV